MLIDCHCGYAMNRARKLTWDRLYNLKFLNVSQAFPHVYSRNHILPLSSPKVDYFNPK